MSVDYDKISDVSKRMAEWERIIQNNRAEIAQAEANITTAQQSLRRYRELLDEELGKNKGGNA